MLSNVSRASTAMKSSMTKTATVRPVAPPAVRNTHARGTAARALLLPREQQLVDPIKALVEFVIDWLEPKADTLVNTEETVPAHLLDEHEGHAGWGHSHIADRLATQSSMSQDFDV